MVLLYSEKIELLSFRKVFVHSELKELCSFGEVFWLTWNRQNCVPL